MNEKPNYIITDSQDIPLAYAVLESPASTPVWQLRILNQAADAVMDHDQLRLVGMDRSTPAVSGRILRRRDDVLWLERGESLGEEIRQNLRVAARFKTFIYPVTGGWKGRHAVVANDLSCGGIAFFCDYPLQPDEIVEIVLPITMQPLLINARILRPRPSPIPTQLFSAKFVNLLEEQDRLICEAVFGQQLLNNADDLRPPL